MDDIPNPNRPFQPGGVAWAPWIWRLAQRVVDGERIALRERDADEVVAILRAAVELVRARDRRRPRPRRRAA